MGKQKKKLPFVSICTPTFNRRPFIPSMLACMRGQTYPKDRMEWIIVDDGTDKIGDLLKDTHGLPTIHYFPLDKKITLGAKRNYTHSKCKGSIIVYMDDDDYYPPERVEHAVERLQEYPDALCAGSSEIYVYFKHIQTMYQGGPYSPTHATAGTFAFRKELLEQTKYNESASLAEEREFLKNYTIPFVQLDPLKTILVFSHIQNTFDKKKLLEHPNELFRPCTKTVDMFIKHPHEKEIKEFFLHKIDASLEKYAPGDPIMKPDVLKQIQEIEAERQSTMNQHGQIMIQRPGEEPRALSSAELVELLKTQQTELQNKQTEIQNLKQTIEEFTNVKLDFTKLNYNNHGADIIQTQSKKIQVLEGVIAKLKQQSNTNTNTVATNTPVDIEITVPTPKVIHPVSKAVPEVMVPIPTIEVR
jgi:glycosyltransferase involved in cell wall biosynthesis